MRKNNILTILGASVMLAGGALTIAQQPQNVEASSQAVIKHNAGRFNKRGRRLGRGYLKKGTRIKVYGTKWIKGQKFFYIGKGRYVKAGNVSLASRYHYNGTGTYYVVNKNCALYNAKGQRIAHTSVKKGRPVFAQGNIVANGKWLVNVGKGIYIIHGNLGTNGSSSSNSGNISWSSNSNSSVSNTKSNSHPSATTLSYSYYTSGTVYTVNKNCALYDANGNRIEHTSVPAGKIRGFMFNQTVKPMVIG